MNEEEMNEEERRKQRRRLQNRRAQQGFRKRKAENEGRNRRGKGTEKDRIAILEAELEQERVEKDRVQQALREAMGRDNTGDGPQSGHDAMILRVSEGRITRSMTQQRAGYHPNGKSYLGETWL